jgi:hypothetical protein
MNKQMSIYDYAMQNYKDCMKMYRTSPTNEEAVHWLYLARNWRDLAHNYL